eukprot:9788062-Lingulodinium_polyedra.AAC.1
MRGSGRCEGPRARCGDRATQGRVRLSRGQVLPQRRQEQGCARRVCLRPPTFYNTANVLSKR